jgi:hypothetical protein
MRFFLILSMLVITSCTYNELSICETDNPSFTYCVEPIFEKNCIGCHFQNNSNGIMPLSNFQEIRDNVINGTVIESIKREVGFMPTNGERLSTEEILIIENWKENGAPNN